MRNDRFIFDSSFQSALFCVETLNSTGVLPPISFSDRTK